MVGPCEGPRRREYDSIISALTAAAAVNLLLLSSGVTHAQDAYRSEAIIGTFDTAHPARDTRAGSRLAFGATRDGDAEADIVFTDTASKDARDDDGDTSRLFAEGEDDLDAGRYAEAQRKFERVIAIDPQGHFAEDARAHLGDLYRAAGSAARPAARPKEAVQLPSESAPASSPVIEVSQPKFETPRSSLGAKNVAASEPLASLQTPLAAPQQAAPKIAEAAVNPGTAVAANVEEEFIATAGDRVFFAVESAELGQRARVVLAAQARWLAQRVDLIAVIEGHADDGPLSKEQLVTLSEARAAAVRDRLIQEGVAASRLTVFARGRQQPVADCASSDCAAQNRRVITILKTRSFGGAKPTQPRAVAADDVRSPKQ